MKKLPLHVVVSREEGEPPVIVELLVDPVAFDEWIDLYASNELLESKDKGEQIKAMSELFDCIRGRFSEDLPN